MNQGNKKLNFRLTATDKYLQEDSNGGSSLNASKVTVKVNGVETADYTINIGTASSISGTAGTEQTQYHDIEIEFDSDVDLTSGEVEVIIAEDSVRDSTGNKNLAYSFTVNTLKSIAVTGIRLLLNYYKNMILVKESTNI